MGLSARLADLLFGRLCPEGCGHRVFTKDRDEHRAKWCLQVNH
jgi:hypothetical protein